MGNVTEIKQRELTAREQAEKEIKDEQREEDVRRFKDLLAKKEKAKKVLKGIDAELEDLKHELEG